MSAPSASPRSVDGWVVSLRPDLGASRRALPLDRPAAVLDEEEPDADGRLRRIRTVFLTNRECPWRCVMCDLWRHTTVEPVPPGAIPAQVDAALAGQAEADWIKLYNAGSFFDAAAIPPSDLPVIARQVRHFRRVIVECHPRLVGPQVARFRDELGGASLEVAMGLESSDPVVLQRLNKGMTPEDFRRAAGILTGEGIGVRAFVLVKPPFQEASQAVEGAVASVVFALEAGARVVTLIPTRGGFGAMAELERRGEFSEPGLDLVEDCFEQALQQARRFGQGRVFVDVWDLDRFGTSPNLAARRARLAAMNRIQGILPCCRKESGQ